MPKAASLAANIEERFAISPVMIEGHEGIFEVRINGETVYTNRSECSVLPGDEEIFSKIEKLTPTVQVNKKERPDQKEPELPNFCELKKPDEK